MSNRIAEGLCELQHVGSATRVAFFDRPRAAGRSRSRVKRLPSLKSFLKLFSSAIRLTLAPAADGPEAGNGFFRGSPSAAPTKSAFFVHSDKYNIRRIHTNWPPVRTRPSRDRS